MQPSVKDTAEFYALALAYGLADCYEVLCWSDRLVEQDDKTPSWLLDLASLKEYAAADAITALHSAPGTINDLVPTKMLLVRAKQLWEQKKLADDQIGRLMVQLIQLGLLPGEFVADAYRIDDGFDLAKMNVWSTRDAEEALRTFFEKLSAFNFLEPAER